MTAGDNAREFILMPEDPIEHRFAPMKKRTIEPEYTNRLPIGFDKLSFKNDAINSSPRLRCVTK